jgi:AcrR family transcriptional regulator
VNSYVQRMKRSGYRLGKRATQQEETRRRIVEATAALHDELGPAATTISAVAERAGVQRLTVYRHFPDEASLIGACAAHAATTHPPPDPAAWNAIGDPAVRVESALRALYGYYAARGDGLANVLRDAERLPALHAALAPMRGYLEAVADGLAADWLPPPHDGRTFRAALGHALDFWSWRSLAMRGLAPSGAARLMARLVSAAADPPEDGASPNQ